MKLNFPKNLIKLANSLDNTLYAVGGVVRNFLIDGSISTDVDLCANISSVDFSSYLNQFGFTILAEYKRTGTVMFTDGKFKYEFTSFREETYAKGGSHTPTSTKPTSDIKKDALRRDFKCNAVYYDIKNSEIVDPLGGLSDIENKVLDTVSKTVFNHDGLRLLRLARFAGQLGFTPTSDVIKQAKINANNILDISPERIYDEIKKILICDTAYPFSDKNGHYTAFKILDETTVLDRIFPELTMGRNMAQRADFHKYDVLEHGLRSMLYAPQSIRLGALLHDIGKPICFKRDGMYYYHFIEGVKIAEKSLKKLKVDKKTIEQVKFLVREHMVDLDCSMSEIKVRKYLVKNQKRLDELVAVKQADFRASLEIFDTAPTLIKWKKIIDKMNSDGTPWEIKDLLITASDLIKIGYQGNLIGKELKRLHALCVSTPSKNNFDTLIEIAKSDIKVMQI